ncbi:MAG: hypothetical protein ACT4P2_13730 [Pseudomonadota bacterium]
MTIPARLADLIERTGQTVTLRRIATTPAAGGGSVTTVNTDTTLKARVRGYGPRQVSGLVQQGDREVWVAASGLAITPRAGDRVAVGGNFMTVVSVNTLASGETAMVHIMQVRG